MASSVVTLLEDPFAAQGAAIRSPRNARRQLAHHLLPAFSVAPKAFYRKENQFAKHR